MRAELGGPGAGEGFQGTLRCAVDRTCGDSEASDPGAEVDDPASARVGHRGDHRGGEKERRLDVDREDSVERLLFGCERAVGWVYACVVDQDGDGSERRGGIGGELGRRRGGPVEIGGHERRTPAGGLNEIHDVGPACGISAGHDHACSLGGHRDCDAFADVAGRSGYQGDLAL